MKKYRVSFAASLLLLFLAVVVPTFAAGGARSQPEAADSGTEADTCGPSCRESESGLIDQVVNIYHGLLRGPKKTNLQSSSKFDPYKTDAELDAYFYRFRKNCSDETYSAFIKEYKKYIQIAAKHFDIPFPILACLIFRESRFDPLAKSDVGAFGLGQFMPHTKEHISRILSDGKKLTSSQLTDFESYQIKVNLGETLTSRERRDHSYYSKKASLHALQARWRNYFAELQSDPEYKKSPYAKYKTPTAFTETGARLPPMAIGATALYVRYLLKNGVGGAPSPGDKNDPLVYIALTGAYNMGLGTALRLTRKMEAHSAQNWIDALSKIKESRFHMESIRRCMAKNETAGPVAGVKKGGALLTENECRNSGSKK